MLLRVRKLGVIQIAALLSAAVIARATNPNVDYITPSFTFSPGDDTA